MSSNLRTYSAKAFGLGLCLLLAGLIGGEVTCVAASVDKSKLPPAATKAADFIQDIQPIFEKSCYGCHGPEKQKGKYRLDVRETALKGGDTGPNIIAGKSADSPLIHYVSGLVEDMKMPAKGDALTAEQIGLLRAWIDQGAQWPEASGTVAVGSKKSHWAFQPPKRPAIPTVANGRWPRNPIDSFILAKLEQNELRPSPPVDKATLIRRLSFDLIGLPPTPEEVGQFVKDRRADAYERLVERLLDSPHYGERWARHWLDVVRFAESNGFETNTPRPNAWPYRDYIIRALNADKPYTQFVLEQLAGDAMGEDAATGFIVGGPWDEVKSPDVNLTLQQRNDELHDMVATTASTFLGLTVGCARCHNHKFDPISQTDYYAMQAVFAGVQHGERPLRTKDYEQRKQEAEKMEQFLAGLDEKLEGFEPLACMTVNGQTNLPLRAPVNARRNVERFAPVSAKLVRFTILATSNLEPCIDELEIFSAGENSRNVALATNGATATASGTYPNSDIHKLEHINDGRYGNGRSWISSEIGKGWVQIEFPQTYSIDRIVWGRDREQKYSDRLATNYVIEVATEPGKWQVIASSQDRKPYGSGSKIEADYAQTLSANETVELHSLLQQAEEARQKVKQWNTRPTVYAGMFLQPGVTFRLYRGDPLQKREQVTPGALEEFGPKTELTVTTPEWQRRLALARWVIDPQNPMTARVMVNRIWQHHFGEGLVSTPSDFGLNGARPSHPELLDWLALEFQKSGWSIKAMHRLIVLSNTYQQSSRPNAESSRVDAAGRLLWRFTPRRLEAEPLRDAILSASGKLDFKMGGPGFDLFEPNNNYVRVYNSKKEFGPGEFRRMIYQTKPRMQLDDTFGAFDCPDAGQIAPRRNSSTTPLQALNLLNSSFTMQQAGFLAERLQRDAGADAKAQVRRAFRLLFAREPSSEEITRSLKLIKEQDLFTFCRAMLNANEFLYVF
ncbi:MAG: hypothetical protein JWQ71_556 [Pedosphaera sp.]|nr:hypothetical protein [Pedosphaera sp.]